MPRFRQLFFALCLPAAAVFAAAQSQFPGAPVRRLDLFAQVRHPRLERALHQPLPERYIWLPGKAPKAAQPDFVRLFQVATPPPQATLYVAGPSRFRVWLNGKPLGQNNRKPGRLRPLVWSHAVSLQPGDNWLAIAVTGKGAGLVAKIVPAAYERFAPALVTSDAHWYCRLNAPAGWPASKPDLSAWQPVRDLGAIESHIDNFQWNADSGLYAWPGYDGISPFLARVPVQALRVLQVAPGAGKFRHLQALYSRRQLHAASLGSGFAVRVPAGAPKSAWPSLVLDFGREITGRIALRSVASQPLLVIASYGESLGETLHPYLGETPIYTLPSGLAYGPKSAFRYVRLQFVPGGKAGWERFRTIRLDGIFYPVHYRGSFVSSDPLLNRIWATGAYTAHLCMLDDIWDAPKRDRGRWMGDLDVSGRVIDTVFADHFLMQDTLNRLVGDSARPHQHDVNGIPGYSAFWVMGERDYFLHTGDLEYLKSLHRPLLALLRYMRSEMPAARFDNAHHAWPFIDWSPGLYGDNPSTRRATQLEFYRAFRNAAWMLRRMGDTAAAHAWSAYARRVLQVAQTQLRTGQTFGHRWQPNAMAVFSGVASPAERRAIWQQSLSRPHRQMITPYYNFYVIDAMAALGHRRHALDWIRQFWGGMIREGATSFWEAYDPSWPKTDFHRHLQADNGMGYFVSLAHGWSSGPTAWLTEQVLGLKPLAPGFRRMSIRPDLLGLRWARGAEPTPHGLVQANYRALPAHRLEAHLTLPSGVVARLRMPAGAGAATLRVNGKTVAAERAEHGRRLQIWLRHAGVYDIRN